MYSHHNGATVSAGQPIAGRAADYPLGHSPQELERLSHQARFIGDLTRALLVDAGVGAGMRVLDVGCGPGDVSFLAASLVGATGSVIGIDEARPALHSARERAAASGLNNVRFVEEDLGTIEVDAPVDAVIGRLVLMYLPDPASALRHLARQLKPGGIVAFQEIDMDVSRSTPRCPLIERSIDRVRRTFDCACPYPRVSLALAQVFADAGLPAPTMTYAARAEHGPDSPLYEMLAGITRTLLPLMERYGIATAAEVDIDTLAARLRDEALARRATVLSPAYVGAWTRIA